MSPEEIETWLWASRKNAVKELTFNEGDKWWPVTNNKANKTRQAEATGWAMGFFIEAALDRCSGPTLTAASASHQKQNTTAKSYRKKMLDNLWVAPGREHSTHEVLVDFSVHNWEATNPVQLTGESEVYPSYGVGDSMKAPDDYSWDFFKLLMIPSVSRLFFARVTGKERLEGLPKTLEKLVDWYAPSLLRHHDELGAVVVPAGKKNAAETQILWLERGRLRCRKVKSSPTF